MQGTDLLLAPGVLGPASSSRPDASSSTWQLDPRRQLAPIPCPLSIMPTLASNTAPSVSESSASTPTSGALESSLGDLDTSVLLTLAKTSLVTVLNDVSSILHPD